MDKYEKQLVVLAHALAHQENEIHYLKALLVEKFQVKIEDIQKEQEDFWDKTKYFRIYETIKNLQRWEQEIEMVPDHLDLNMYRDHLRWPTDPPEEPA